MSIRTTASKNEAARTGSSAWRRPRSRVRRIYQRIRTSILRFFGVVASVIVVSGSAGCADSGTRQVARGSISLAWSIVDLSHLATTCDRAGDTTVVLRMRNRAGVASIASFPCASSPRTAEVIAGTYDVTPDLHATDGSVLASAPEQPGITVGANQVVTLAAATRVANTKGTLAISTRIHHGDRHVE